ncbi:hypothetical protein BRD13_04200 [Halobacteriales archaeon SW_5_70_135]|nr:MAG: hypothetical protein BRD13_04200 [Halobacteriales archaeon SW_5_70_135]
MLRHLPALPAVYRECRRVLRFGGRFVRRQRADAVRDELEYLGYP